MQKITNVKGKQTEPLTIALSGRDAELLRVFIGDVSMEQCEKAAKTSYAHYYKVSADELDGMTDELFGLLNNHVKGD